jgi:GTP cyclohydrolase II
LIIEREDEIEDLNENESTLRMHYENLIRESMQSAKNKVIESLPNLIKTSKQKVQVVAN